MKYSKTVQLHEITTSHHDAIKISLCKAASQVITTTFEKCCSNSVAEVDKVSVELHVFRGKESLKLSKPVKGQTTMFVGFVALIFLRIFIGQT